MKYRMLVRMTLAAALTVALALPLFADSQADAVMRKSYDLPQATTMQATMYMLLVDANGTQNLRSLSTYSRRTADGTDTYTEFLSPPDLKGTKFLSLAGAREDVQRIWLPELHKVRRIAGGSKGDTFFGSDLTYYDMSTHHYSDARYSMHGEATVEVVENGVKKEVACWVIDATPVSPGIPYGKMRLWVGKSDDFTYRSEMWDSRGNELKTIYILEVEKKQGITLPIRTGVVAASGHKTLLQMKDVVLNGPINQGVFTVANLER